MKTVSCTYQGDLSCTSVHNQSGNIIITDAPTDHAGRGRSFSPTDLIATSLGTCILTFMGIHSHKNGYDMLGATCDVQKIMGSDPERNVEKLELYVCLPPSITNEQAVELQEVAHHCPVLLSIICHVDIEFHWTCEV